MNLYYINLSKIWYLLLGKTQVWVNKTLWWLSPKIIFQYRSILIIVIRLDDLLNFGPLFKAFGNN